MRINHLILRTTLGMIAGIQLILGVIFIGFPAEFARFNALPAAPAWVSWLFMMFGARLLGFAVGMLVALRKPQQHKAWIYTMIGVQLIDWGATLYFLLRGAVTLAQVSTAAFLPVLFVVGLTVGVFHLTTTDWQGARA